MRHNDVIYLLSTDVVYNEYGVPKEVTAERKVYANQLSVNANEFYTAGVQGLKPERQFEVYAFDYGDETYLLCNDVKYRIIRTQVKGEKIRLICERERNV